MTERRPPGVSFESWIDQQIRAAQERGEFDDLPGTGKPLPGLDRPHDELWWVRGKIRSEGLPTDVLLPPGLQLRREVDRLPEMVRHLRTEQEVREVVQDLNRRIAEWIRIPTGPIVPLRPVHTEAVLQQWRAERPGSEPPQDPGSGRPDGSDPEPDPAAETGRQGWWRRLTARLRARRSGP